MVAVLVVVHLEGCIRIAVQDMMVLTGPLVVLTRFIIRTLRVGPRIRKCATVERLLDVGRESSIARLIVIARAIVVGRDTRLVGEGLRVWAGPVGLRVEIKSGRNLLDVGDLNA